MAHRTPRTLKTTQYFRLHGFRLLAEHAPNERYASQLHGTPANLSALDRLLGLEVDEYALNEDGVPQQPEVEGGEEDEEDMPLVCDVCGKTPDVEVSTMVNVRGSRTPGRIPKAQEFFFLHSARFVGAKRLMPGMCSLLGKTAA